MKLSTGFLAVVVGLLLLAAIAPPLIALSHAFLPLVIVIVVGVIAVRVAFFHTRRF